MAPSNPTTYEYDPVGNQSGNSAGQSLTYNAKDQTTSITPVGGAPTAFGYTGATQDDRTRAGSRNFTNSVLGVAYAYPGSLPPELSPLTAWTRDDGGTLVGQRSPDTPADADLDPDRHYYLFDGLGSVVAMTDQAGGVANRYRYDPYGNTLGTPTETVSNPWRYAGGYQDTETGLTKFGARYHDATLGRWTQPDPSGQDANPYSYVGGDPVNKVDPTGLFSWDCGRISCTASFDVVETQDIAFGGAGGAFAAFWKIPPPFNGYAAAASAILAASAAMARFKGRCLQLKFGPQYLPSGGVRVEHEDEGEGHCY